MALVNLLLGYFVLPVQLVLSRILASFHPLTKHFFNNLQCAHFSWKTSGNLKFSSKILENSCKFQFFFSGPWKTPGKLKFSSRTLENLWKFQSFFQGPGKLLEKQIVSLYYWKSPGILKVFFQGPGKLLQKQVISLYSQKTPCRNFLITNW